MLSSPLRCLHWQDTVRLSRTPRVTAHTTMGTVPREVTAHCRAHSVPSAVPSSVQDLQRGRQKGTRKGQVGLGLALSNDVLDAAVQEHVLILQEKKGGQRQVSDRDLQVTD